MHLVIFAILIISSLLGSPLEERAKHAEILLGQFYLDEAFKEYTSILKEIPNYSFCEKSDLEFAYWIHRERSYAAFLMDNLATMQTDIEKMQEILIFLDFSPDYGMDEYYYAIKLAQKAKDYLKDYYRQPNLAFSIGSWFQKSWNSIKVGSEKFRAFTDESYCRIVHNEDRLEQIYAQKRAQELYYSHLKYSQIEMDHLARTIQKKDIALWQDLSCFFREHSGHLTFTASSLAASILSAEMGNASGAWAAFLACGPPAWEIMNCIRKEGGPIWDKYESLQNDRGRLTRMNLQNREASYVKCILENKTPQIYYAPENDTPWYSGYYFMDMNNERFEFKYGLTKQF